MAWVEFAFPRCPECARSWAVSRHRDCPAGVGRDGSSGGLDIDPDRAQVRCTGCRRGWEVWETRFHCSCGHRFEAYEVEEAVREIIRVAALLARVLAQQAKDLAEIRSAGEASFRAWVGRFAEAVAGSLGAMAGRLVGTLLRAL
ncbi:hypothetical protein ACGFR6_16240 [Streptomyces sp. NPDC048567]|uniref:hypothetical protein n=1 Tax=Streptomyces sp. NPDC048567 TaxID=3365570 RepID=UPI0037132BAA